MEPVIRYATIDEAVYFDEIMTINDDLIKVTFENIGEGWGGDYNENDPEDEELIRFTVHIKREEENGGVPWWDEVDDASYCTTIPVDTPKSILEKKIRIIFNEYRNVATHILEGGSVKKLGERLSWI